MNLLLIEDEIKTANALKKGLEENGYAVNVARNGREALVFLEENRYQLVISDIILPGRNGLALCKEIRTNDPKLPVLLLTALNSKDDVVAGFEAGADDYLSKPFDFRELLARIKVLTKRSAVATPEKVLQFENIVMNPGNRTVTRDGKIISLTAREFSLLEYFIRKQNVVISRAELARDIWNLDFNTGTNIVEVYINYLRNKIDKPFEKKLIHNVHGVGYILKSN